MQGCVLLRSVPGGINYHTGLHCMALIKNEFSNFRGLWKISLGLAWLPELQKKVSQSSNLQEDWSSTLVVGLAKLWLSVCSADGAFISTSCGKLEWIRSDALTFSPLFSISELTSNCNILPLLLNASGISCQGGYIKPWCNLTRNVNITLGASNRGIDVAELHYPTGCLEWLSFLI